MDGVFATLHIATDWNIGSQIIMNNRIEEDEQFRQVFHGECDIAEDCLDTIGDIKNNYPNKTILYIDTNEQILTESGWRLLGGYIANNTYLTQIILEGPGLIDSNMFPLFESFHSSSLLKVLGLCSSNIRISGVRFQLVTTIISTQNASSY